jgi:hypothetical protein
MTSTTNHLAPSKTSTFNQLGRARSTRLRGPGRPSSSNPNPITSFFKAIPKPVEITVHKNIVCSSLPVKSHHDKCTIPAHTQVNKHTSKYTSHYPNFYTFKYNTCKNSKCKTCPAADPEQINNNHQHLIFCKTYGCIYMITCKICNLQYIGQTSTHLNIRMNLHRSNTNSSKEKINTLEIEHFKKHGFENINIRIIDIVPETKTRLWWENKHINQFLTIFPYGLNTILFNQQINKHYIIDPKK